MSERPVKAALVGVGGWGRRLAEAATRSPSLTLVAACDAQPAAREAFTAQWGVPTVPDLAYLLANPDVESVLLATPNPLHAAQTAQAAQAGKHVFVEKPIASSVAEARQMQQRCAAAGVTLMVGHNTRRHAGHRQLKQLLNEGALGTVVMAEAQFSWEGGMRLTGAEWRAHRDACPAVGLMQLGIHHADTLQYLLGPVSEVTALFAHVATPVDIDDVTLTLLRFATGPLAYLGSNYAAPHRFHIALFGTRANATCDQGGSVQLQFADGSAETRAVTEVDTVAEELTEFGRAIRAGTGPETDAEAGLRALAVVEAAIESAAQRRAIALDSLGNLLA